MVSLVAKRIDQEDQMHAMLILSFRTFDLLVHLHFKFLTLGVFHRPLTLILPQTKVSRYKWEAYGDANWWCIYYFLPGREHTFAKVSQSKWEVYLDGGNSAVVIGF